MLGLEEDDTTFDKELIIHINGAFSTLTQLGVGPVDGFVIDKDTDWPSFIGENVKNLEMLKEYIYLSVKLIFDAPSNSFTIQSFEDKKKELEWRLYFLRDTEIGRASCRERV